MTRSRSTGRSTIEAFLDLTTDPVSRMAARPSVAAMRQLAGRPKQLVISLELYIRTLHNVAFKDITWNKKTVQVILSQDATVSVLL